MFESDTTTIEAPVVNEVEAYKVRVRERALAARDHMSWDTESLNKTLTTLGVTPYEEVTVALPLKGTNTYTITPSRRSGETAEQLVERVKAMSDADILSGTAYHTWVIERGEPVVTNVGTDGEADPDASTTDLATYKRLVRRVAIAVGKERSWCDDGVNEYLRALDLPEKVRHGVPVEVTTTSRVIVYVDDAESAEEARKRVEAGEATQVEEAVASQFSRAATLVGHKVANLEDTKVGDMDVTVPHPTRSTRCGAYDPSRSWLCTRPAGHEGQHIAGDAYRVVAVFPQV